MIVSSRELCNGELICALGRHGNNQMYPIAWEIVLKEAGNC